MRENNYFLGFNFHFTCTFYSNAFTSSLDFYSFGLYHYVDLISVHESWTIHPIGESGKKRENYPLHYIIEKTKMPFMTVSCRCTEAANAFPLQHLHNGHFCELINANQYWWIAMWYFVRFVLLFVCIFLSSMMVS